MIRKVVIASLMLVFVYMLLRKFDRIEKVTQVLNKQFKNIWLGLTKV